MRLTSGDIREDRNVGEVIFNVPLNVLGISNRLVVFYPYFLLGQKVRSESLVLGYRSSSPRYERWY